LRLGAVYAGYRGQRFGWSSDGIRAAVQNKGIHDALLPALNYIPNVIKNGFSGAFKAGASPYFPETNRGSVLHGTRTPSVPYYYNGNVNGFTIW
jgi:hypothetical protein